MTLCFKVRCLKREMGVLACTCRVTSGGGLVVGLAQVESGLRDKGIPFYLLLGDPTDTVANFCQEQGAGVLVCDFSPLRVPMHWTQSVAAKLQDELPVFQVDAHNVVPVWVASDKQEVGARTLRPKIHKHLSRFLIDFPQLEPNVIPIKLPPKVDWVAASASLTIDRNVRAVPGVQPGVDGARKQLAVFGARIKDYDKSRNDPNGGKITDTTELIEARENRSKGNKWCQLIVFTSMLLNLRPAL